MKQSFKRLASMITALMLVILAFIIYFQFTEPEYNDIQLIRGQEAGRRAFVEKQQSAITQVKKLIDAYKSDVDFRTVVSTSFPQGAELSSAVAQISGLISLNNLNVQSIAISETKAQNPQNLNNGEIASTNIVKPINTIIFKIQLAGTYNDLKNFLKNLETNIRVFDVNLLSIRPLAKSNQDFYSINIDVATYYQGK